MSTASLPSLRELSRQIADGDTTPVELVKQCLARIRERDDTVRAWSYVAADEALNHAQQRTEELTNNPPRSPLHGIPFGVKDIFDTAGMPTEWGSALHKGRVPEQDAAVVADLTKAGAVILGKTHTTAYAYFDPALTRNPHNPGHTPGGSSSGSAAAVADGMVPFALGSQTMGSVLRPASFCGITGLKPAFGRLSVKGVLPFAPTLDHPGLFTVTADDMAFLWLAMMGPQPASEPAAKFAVPKWPIEGELEPDMKQKFPECLEKLRSGGLTIEPITLPESLQALPGVIDTVLKFEAAGVHEERFRRHGAEIGRKLAELIEEGLQISEAEYKAALDKLDAARRDFAVLMERHPVWITPAALGPAPGSLETTGDPRCNAPFTALGAPALSLPFAKSNNGLPLGLQLAVAVGLEGLLLATAQEVERSLQQEEQ